MEDLKDKIINILNTHSSISYGAGSCGELGDSINSIDSQDIGLISEEILEVVKFFIENERR